MKTYKALLWDIDGTLLDFGAVELVALNASFKALDLGKFTKDMLERYIPINRKYWSALERGELTKQEVLLGRFREFFETEVITNCDPAAMNDEYQRQLASHFVFCEYGEEIIREMKEKGYRQFAATNGTKVAQDGKLKISGLIHFLEKAFISEEIGHEKPMSGFYEAIFKALPDMDPKEMLMIGDTLTSDILGGNRAGIDTCWYNPKGLENTTEAIPTYEIKSLKELENILD